MNYVAGKSNGCSFEFQQVIIIMGCVPPEKRQQSKPATSISAKKLPSLKHLSSNKSRDSSTSIENKQLKVPIENNPSLQSLKQTRKQQINPSSPNSKAAQVEDNRFEYHRKQPSPTKPAQKNIIRVIAPTENKSNSKQKLEEASKIVSVHSLDIHSRIKPTAVISNRTNVVQPQASIAQPDINITFNNNNFVTANSRSSGGVSTAKKWREQLLKEQLKGMNEEQFRKINIQSMNFN